MGVNLGRKKRIRSPRGRTEDDSVLFHVCIVYACVEESEGGRVANPRAGGKRIDLFAQTPGS